jgi:hypothetical protein
MKHYYGQKTNKNLGFFSPKVENNLQRVLIHIHLVETGDPGLPWRQSLFTMTMLRNIYTSHCRIHCPRSDPKTVKIIKIAYDSGRVAFCSLKGAHFYPTRRSIALEGA